MARRRYSDDDRANALAALAANKGNVKLTAKQLNIPSQTLRHWAKGSRHPESAKMGDEKKRDMATALDAIAWKLIDSIPDKIERAPLQQTTTALGTVIDKARLLRGESTENVADVPPSKRIAEAEDAYATAADRPEEGASPDDDS